MFLERDGKTKCYRRSIAKQIFFAGCSVFFFMITVRTAYFFYFSSEIEYERVVRATVLGGFWCVWLLVSLGLFAYYSNYKLCLNLSRIQRSQFDYTEVVYVSRIDEMLWATLPSGGSIQLRGDFGVWQILFGDFSARNRLELIAYFRTIGDEICQVGREQFDFHFFRSPVVRAQQERFTSTESNAS